MIEDADIDYIEVYRFADHDTTNIMFVGSLPYAPDSSKFIDKFSGVQSPSDKIWSYFIVPYDEAGNSTKSDTVSYKLIDKSTIFSPAPEQEFTTDEEITFSWEEIPTCTYRLLIFDTTHTLQQSINDIDSTSFTTTPSDMGLPFSGTYLCAWIALEKLSVARNQTNRRLFLQLKNRYYYFRRNYMKN